MYIMLMYTLYAGIINDGPSNFTYLPNVTSLPINLTCNVTGVVRWRINGAFYIPTNHTNGTLPGHRHAGTNLSIHCPVNYTEYICVSTSNYSILISDPAWIIIAGEDLRVICYVIIEHIYTNIRICVLHSYIHYIYLYI